MRSEHTTPRRARRTRRATAIAAAVAALVVVPVASASAHVHVTPASTVTGASTTMTFRVPNESDTASTTGLTVTLPTTTPLISVSVRPVPGWTATVTQGDLPSPVVVGDYIYRSHRPGLMKCIDVKTGKVVYEQRLEGASTAASPFAAKDRIYFASAGKTVVIAPGPKFELLAVNDLGEPGDASAAVSAGRIVLKGSKHLFCVGTK